jgi:hypothetical protein
MWLAAGTNPSFPLRLDNKRSGVAKERASPSAFAVRSFRSRSYETEKQGNEVSSPQLSMDPKGGI